MTLSRTESITSLYVILGGNDTEGELMVNE